MKINRRKTRLGFTLTELLVVIAIIVILAGIGVGSFAFVKERQDKEKARVQMALLSRAIEEYKLDMGEYPGTDSIDEKGDASDQLYQALFRDGYDYTELSDNSDEKKNWDKATKIYVPELDPRSSTMKWFERLSKKEIEDKFNAKTPWKIKDPWLENYRYRKGTYAENPDFDLWSSGKDKKTNDSDPDMSIEENKDDLRNF